MDEKQPTELREKKWQLANAEREEDNFQDFQLLLCTGVYLYSNTIFFV